MRKRTQREKRRTWRIVKEKLKEEGKKKEERRTVTSGTGASSVAAHGVGKSPTTTTGSPHPRYEVQCRLAVVTLEWKRLLCPAEQAGEATCRAALLRAAAVAVVGDGAGAAVVQVAAHRKGRT